MSDKQTKELRKATRVVIQDLLPTILTAELVDKVYKQLQTQMQEQLADLSRDVRASMERVEARNKDAMAYLIRTVTSPTPQTAAALESAAPEKKEDRKDE